MHVTCQDLGPRWARGRLARIRRGGLERRQCKCRNERAVCVESACTYDLDCELRAEQGCTPDCMALFATPCAEPMGTSAFKGCLENSGCTGAATCAADPEASDPFLFPSGCIPEGWALCSDSCL